MKRLSEANPGPSPALRGWIIKATKIGIALEALTFIGGYGVYYQMKNSPGMFAYTIKPLTSTIEMFYLDLHIPTEFAKFMNENCPLVIETSNKVLDFYDSINPFKETIEKWKTDKKN